MKFMSVPPGGVTRVVRVPTPELPITVLLQTLAEELEMHSVDTTGLRESIACYRQCIAEAAEGIRCGDRTKTKASLARASRAMREIQICLRFANAFRACTLPLPIVHHIAMARDVLEAAISDVHGTAAALQ